MGLLLERRAIKKTPQTDTILRDVRRHISQLKLFLLFSVFVQQETASIAEPLPNRQHCANSLSWPNFARDSRLKFHLKSWIRLLCLLPGSKNAILAKSLTLGAPVPSLLYRWGPNLVCWSRPMVDAYVPNFVTIGLFYLIRAAKNPKFCRFFGIRRFVVSPVGGIRRKLDMNVQLQTFPYPVV